MTVSGTNLRVVQPHDGRTDLTVRGLSSVLTSFRLAVLESMVGMSPRSTSAGSGLTMIGALGSTGVGGGTCGATNAAGDAAGVAAGGCGFFWSCGAGAGAGV